MAINLDKMDRAELLKLKADIEKTLVKKAAEEKKQARAEAEKAVAKFGFSLAEVVGAEPGRKPAKARSVGAVKYVNPADPTKTWTGRGRRPEWIKELDAAGKLETALV